MSKDTFSSPQMAQATEMLEQALALMPDDAPELEPYTDWKVQVIGLLNMALMCVPEEERVARHTLNICGMSLEMQWGAVYVREAEEEAPEDEPGQ